MQKHERGHKARYLTKIKRILRKELALTTNIISQSKQKWQRYTSKIQHSHQKLLLKISCRCNIKKPIICKKGLPPLASSDCNDAATQSLSHFSEALESICRLHNFKELPCICGGYCGRGHWLAAMAAETRTARSQLPNACHEIPSRGSHRFGFKCQQRVVNSFVACTRNDPPIPTSGIFLKDIIFLKHECFGRSHRRELSPKHFVSMVP